MVISTFQQKDDHFFSVVTKKKKLIIENHALLIIYYVLIKYTALFLELISNKGLLICTPIIFTNKCYLRQNFTCSFFV